MIKNMKMPTIKTILRIRYASVADDAESVYAD
jgi:hypothetical protein